jgi:exodeoxyribonuclease VII small subunit
VEITFETALKELEGIVRSLEEGKLPLDESLKSFARGVELAAYCQQMLTEAKTQVKELTVTLEGMSLRDME